MIIMGVGSSTNTVFYHISNGKIVRQFSYKTNSSVERVNKNNRTVNEEFYDYLDGFLVDVYVKDSDYGKFWNIVVQDQQSGIKQNLQVSYSSGYAVGFLKALPNVDVNKTIKLIPYAKKESDKTKTTIFIKQNDASLKWFFTKHQPNGLPQLVKVKVKGREAWDDTSAMAFLETMVKTKIVPRLLQKLPQRFSNTQPIIGSNDGLPF